MDKNTLWGVICMAAIFFGFMYCNRPTQEQLDAQKAAVGATARTAADNTPAIADSLSASLEANLADAVRTLGHTDANDSRSIILADENFSLRLDSASLSGNVIIGNDSVRIADLRTITGSAITPDMRAKSLAAISGLIARVQKYKGFARNLGGKNTITTIENDLIKVDISSRGGMVSAVTLKKYNTETGDSIRPVQLFQGDKDGYSFTITTTDQRLDTREFNFTPVVESDSSVMMTLDLADGAIWGIRYALHPSDYLVTMEIVQKGATGILPQSTASVDFNWHQTMARNEKGRVFEERNSAIYYKYVGDTPDYLSDSKDDAKQLNGRIKWVAFKNQFFSSVIIPRAYFTTADLHSTIIKSDRFLKDMDMTASLPYTTADGTVAVFDFYFGPNDYPLLSKLDDAISPDEDLDLTRLIPLGWGFFRYINTWIVIPVFTFLSSFISNYGIIILLLTIFIKLIIFPFTFKSFKSQARMRVLQPEIKEINDKYPGQENAMKRQQETMALYSRTGASPFSGCLPMIFQMPVLIAMFSFFPSAIELRGQSFLWAHDLSAPDFIVTLPFSIPFYGNGVSLFCLLMTIVNVVYMHLNMQNQPGGNSMPGMKFMTYIMPVMFLFIFNDYASGLSYYYFLSLLITIVQT
ncbi:MAG: membrane protein insertase YidC, partial [Muribaculaceae bacterium]|nr:membrane protein insertase YidC [Muribaculaceae bacterium]